MQLAADVLLFLDESGAWIASNPMARCHAAVSPSVLDALRAVKAGGAFAPQGEIWCEDRTKFGCGTCALDDATGFSAASGTRVSGAEAVLAKLQERLILIEDPAAYRARFGMKTKPLDPEHLGNFHQQLGHELVFRQRKKPDDWWVSQKFSDDLSAVRPTAYKKVQEDFLKREVPKWGLRGKNLLDAGCGVGYYSNFFAKHGASVLGLDPSADYIARAKKTFTDPKLRFEVFDFKDPNKLSQYGAGTFDLIYLADVLLFYFVSYKNKPEELAGAVGFLKALKAMLAPGGRIVVMDPHGSFSLCTRYGDPARPLAVLTEYRRRDFAIAATLEPLGLAFRAAGLAVTGMWEPAYEGPVKDAEDAFLKEFPVWWVFELKAA
jgi:2-polyprenyl-3-methyl-5-hydroxy-6-metoxy-1,4-benzoquinol methylase